MSESERVLSLPDVLAVVGIKKSLLYELVGKSKFPQAICLSARRRGWLSSEVSAWIAARASERAVA
jgi:prophage regulatory protein